MCWGEGMCSISISICPSSGWSDPFGLCSAPGQDAELLCSSHPLLPLVAFLLACKLFSGVAEVPVGAARQRVHPFHGTYINLVAGIETGAINHCAAVLAAQPLEQPLQLFPQWGTPSPMSSGRQSHPHCCLFWSW